MSDEVENDEREVIEFDAEDLQGIVFPSGTYLATITRAFAHTKESDAKFNPGRTSVAWTFVLAPFEDQDRLEANVPSTIEDDMTGHKLDEWTVAGGPGAKGRVARYESFCRALGFAPDNFAPKQDIPEEGIERYIKVVQKQGWGDNKDQQVNNVTEIISPL